MRQPVSHSKMSSLPGQSREIEGLGGRLCRQGFQAVRGSPRGEVR
jgi:hypothetical protein